MNAHPAEAVSVVLLLLVLAGAVFRPWGRSEALVAVPAAGTVVAVGALSLDHAAAEAARLGPVIGFLAAVLVLAHLCEREGLFRACGAWMADRAAGSPRRLLVLVFVTASLITAVLSLDATVVLLTPTVFATAARLGVRAGPHLYACAHLANSASLLLPVSNLTNLLAFAASGLTFTRFAALMALPWLVAIGTEYLVIRWFFAGELAAGGRAPDLGRPRELPLSALLTVAATLAGFVVLSAFGAQPVWAAVAGAAVLAVPALARGRTSVRELVQAAALPFCLFVLALGMVVRAVVDNGLGAALGRLLPDGTGLLALFLLAALAAVLANLINNLPAVLVLLPLTAPAHPGAVLAVLLGVNIGPNLTYTGSLATLLWRRVVRGHGTDVRLGEFTRLGLVSVPLVLSLSVLALWVSLRTVGS
ncbi:arsenic transporter [Streptomyces sp. IpFD-1.1]|uniref:SLC13 family permease n=1 Tax=Streptomyces TaxID=1883 RepID=UPI0020962944|nr:SLC13 family permease [Streptomyces sp. IpFD-1.1]MCO6749937.1 arsenic transporter [Streptomyces sp. IpFD-1.1]WTC42415.1 SLC13 family permease [Streptomyces albidoflavus]WTD43165.1 SLC13 family permease [Streptomyces albidoflavus]WTD82563.1 SLC13 family permease [Streptomyces albidoflavus]